MRVLVACEFSGRVREAFRRLGHEAYSCDLLPSEIPGAHYQEDVRNLLGMEWDLMVAHPPCTHLAVSGARWFKEKRAEQQDALGFVHELMDAPIPKIAIENPISIISSKIRKPDQIVQPWMFGHEATKTTCLWLKNLPKLVPTNIVGKGEFVTTRSGRVLPKWYSNAHGKNGTSRSDERSRTYQGLADAMAEQWGRYISTQDLDRVEK